MEFLLGFIGLGTLIWLAERFFNFKNNKKDNIKLLRQLSDDIDYTIKMNKIIIDTDIKSIFGYRFTNINRYEIFKYKYILLSDLYKNNEDKEKIIEIFFNMENSIKLSKYIENYTNSYEAILDKGKVYEEMQILSKYEANMMYYIGCLESFNKNLSKYKDILSKKLNYFNYIK